MSGCHSEKLVAFTSVMLPEDESIRDEIRLSVENPDAYGTKFQRRLQERGINGTTPELPLFALIDGLIDRGFLTEIDWKATPDDVIWSIDRLLESSFREPEDWEWVNASEWGGVPLVEFITAVAEHLSKRGLVLTSLDSDSDSYTLLLLDQAKFADCWQAIEQSRCSTLREWAKR